ncbi:hypothetical protein SKAU_G00186860 [Synaphobranchus kaupii]|uniref:Tudor domain-containing protein n=1 Tax=Synaphobranchus kaupii TaxID=118154 RepID=A0A9Q1FCX9_SYNKA|nr:hypothetical protein SKAU_G00186860 [Synaphobranchus kaupii]
MHRKRKRQWKSVNSVWWKTSSLAVGSEITGYIQGLLPHKVLVLEAPDVNKDLLKLDLGRHVDRDTFLLLVEMLTEVPLKQNSESVPDLLIEKQIGQEFSFRPSSLHGFENILSFCSPKLSVGKKERARVTAAVNPGAFYCQLRSMGKDLKEMSDKLSRACESESKVCSDKNIGNLGLLCSVKGKNEKWHRGFVQYLPVNSQVRVLFIDYGYCESVRVKNILQLPSEFLSVPIVAFPCALSCLSEQDEVVLKRQLNYLKRGLLGEELEIQIDYFNAQQNLYSVTLEGVDVEETESPVSETTKSDVVYEVEKHSFQSGLALQYTDETKECISSNAEYFKEIKEDAIFEGFVEHVLNPTSFWLRTEERNRDFEDLLKDMTEYFSRLKLDEGILENPVPGALCCAMYEKDMHYYRALVTDTIEKGAEVYFIDFGNTEKVPYMLIKTLPPKFALEPEFALKCSLSHVVPMEDVWTVSATDYFRQIVSNKALLVHVVHKRKREYVVELYEKGNAGESIALLMTNAKMAEYWKRTFTDPVQFDGANKAGKFEQTADFWCQLKSKFSKLDELMEKIQWYYETHADPWQQNESCCIVKCPNNGKWYRGCVLRDQAGELDVILVDTGMVVKEKAHNLRAIKAEYLELEGQAFRCSIYNIEPGNSSVGAWRTNACNVLKLFAKENSQDLKCTIYTQLVVKNKGLTNAVDLHTPFKSAKKFLLCTERICQKSLLISFRQYVSEAHWEVDIVSGGVNVAMELVDAGYASYIDNMLGLRLQQRRSPIGASQLKFIPRIVRSTLKLKPEPQPAEAKEASALAQLEFDKNTHRQEHADQGNCQATGDSKNQSDEGTSQDPARKREEEASANESSIERTMNQQVSKKLTKPMPGAGKCIQM